MHNAYMYIQIKIDVCIHEIIKLPQGFIIIKIWTLPIFFTEKVFTLYPNMIEGAVGELCTTGKIAPEGANLKSQLWFLYSNNKQLTSFTYACIRALQQLTFDWQGNYCLE